LEKVIAASTRKCDREDLASGSNFSFPKLAEYTKGKCRMMRQLSVRTFILPGPVPNGPGCDASLVPLCRRPCFINKSSTANSKNWLNAVCSWTIQRNMRFHNRYAFCSLTNHRTNILHVF